MYYNIVKILTVIKKYLNGWEPTDIFRDRNIKFTKYNTPDISFFGTSYGSWDNDFNYTKLGQWFEDAPDIISLLKLFWYIPAWVVYIIVNILWGIIELFLSKSIRNNL